MSDIDNIVCGDVWFVNFPLEDDSSKFLDRPVVVLDVEKLEVLSVKVTTSEPRDIDEYDTPIVYWQEAKLKFKSTARVAKTIYVPKYMFRRRIGTLHSDDLQQIQELFMRYISSQE